MSNEEIYCPHCGTKTPNFNYCANCGEQIKDFYIEKTLDTAVSSEEIIIAALTATDMGASKFRGKAKNVFFTTNYILEDEASGLGFFGNAMSFEVGGDLMQENVNEKIDINEIRQEKPDLKIIPYAEIEKAEVYVTRFNTYLEIKALSFTPKYVLGAKKYGDQFLNKIRSILEPKIGDRFIVK